MNIVLSSIFSPSMYLMSSLDILNEIENSLQVWSSLLFYLLFIYLFVLFCIHFLSFNT